MLPSAVRAWLTQPACEVGRVTFSGICQAGGYLGLVSGALTIDMGVGQRARALGPMVVIIDAPRDVVFAVLSEPYLGRQTRAIADKIGILERGEDVVLAAHRTLVGVRRVAVTVETVRFTSPSRVVFGSLAAPCRTLWSSLISPSNAGGPCWSTPASSASICGRSAPGGVTG